MVLYYGLLALETANNTAAAARMTTTTTARTTRKKQKHSSNPIGSMISLPSSSSSSSNSWIYTEDLRKRFEERYNDCHYVFVPIYIDRHSSRHSNSTMTIASRPASHPSTNHEHSWMYSRSIRDRLFYSTSKISLPYPPPTISSSSSSCVTNRAFMRDENSTISSKIKLKKVPTSAPNLSSSPFARFSSVFFPTSQTKHRTNDVVVEEEDDEETVDDEGHSVPLLKHDGASSPVVPSSLSVSRTTALPTSNNHAGTTSDLALSPSVVVGSSPSLIKRAALHKNKLTRLRSFFFKSSSPSFSYTQPSQASLSTSSLSNRIGKHE